MMELFSHLSFNYFCCFITVNPRIFVEHKSTVLQRMRVISFLVVSTQFLRVYQFTDVITGVLQHHFRATHSGFILVQLGWDFPGSSCVHAAMFEHLEKEG